MSVIAHFMGIKNILIAPVTKVERLNPSDGVIFWQKMDVYFEDGSMQTISFHFEPGQRALALGEVVE